ncbi:unnamed protein product [Ambrosiozyma monospora]|uniref:Unnamed protein product n=1 Tax=Ambrosiozyma monospora TaxID=43982 RepID=A0ACB5TYI5_AMBMO|nr:unnamed protein product [Ambrosiozyma monospora]
MTANHEFMISMAQTAQNMHMMNEATKCGNITSPTFKYHSATTNDVKSMSSNKVMNVDVHVSILTMVLTSVG